MIMKLTLESNSELAAKQSETWATFHLFNGTEVT